MQRRRRRSIGDTAAASDRRRRSDGGAKERAYCKVAQPKRRRSTGGATAELDQLKGRYSPEGETARSYRRRRSNGSNGGGAAKAAKRYRTVWRWFPPYGGVVTAAWMRAPVRRMKYPANKCVVPMKHRRRLRSNGEERGNCEGKRPKQTKGGYYSHKEVCGNIRPL